MAFFVFKIISWNWKHLIKEKVQAKKVFWHKYYTVICAMLCVSFSSKFKASNIILKHILKFKAHGQSIQARKKLFFHLIVKNYLSNIFCKFLIKIESTWRCNIKEQTSLLTSLYCDRTVKSSYKRCSIKISCS